MSTSRTYREIPLSFEKGMVTAWEPSVIEDGAAVLIENFFPEQFGGARVRQGWSKSPTTGGPSTSKGLGLGIYSRSRRPYARQRKVVTGTTAVSTSHTFTLTWDTATEAGSTLYIRFGYYNLSSPGALWPTSLFSGYQVLLDAVDNTTPSNDVRGNVVFLKENAASESSTSLSATTDSASQGVTYVIEAVEFKNIDTGTPTNLLEGLISNSEWAGGVYGSSPVALGWEGDLAISGNVGYEGSGHSGRYCVGVTTTLATDAAFGTKAGTAGQAVSPSTQYTASFWAKSSWASREVTPKLLWYTSAGTYISTSSGTLVSMPTNSTWYQAVVTATSPSNAAYVKIQGYFTGSSQALDYEIDDVQLELGGTATTWVPGRITCVDKYAVGKDGTSPTNLSTSGVLGVPVSYGIASLYVSGTALAGSHVSAWTNSYVEQTDASIEVGTYDMAYASAEKLIETRAANSVDATNSFGVDVHWALVNLKAKNYHLTDRWYFAAQDDTTSVPIYYIDRTGISSGSWTLLETLSIPSSGVSVDFASGLGSLVYTHPAMQYPRRWLGFGTTSSDLSAAPGGGNSITYHKTRFFLGGIYQTPTRLYYSDVGDVTVWPSANYIEVGKDDGETIVDVASQENVLVIGKGSGIWSLSGAGPDTFFLTQMPYGEAAPGRSICPTPYGTVVAGTTAVWGIVASSIESLSKALGASYAPQGYVHTAYADDHLYVLDVTAKVVWVCNLTTQAWHKETIDGTANQPVALLGTFNRLLASPAASTDTGLIYYKDLPAASRSLDFSPLTKTVKLLTPDMWLVGPRSKMTPHWLFLQVRQRGTGAQTLTVKSYYDGVLKSTDTVGAHATEGAWRERIDLGDAKGVSSIQFSIEYASTGNMYDVETAILGVDEETIR